MSKKTPASPSIAARCHAPIDHALDHALFKALADPTRTRILACLAKCRRPCSVTEIAQCCSVDFSVVSRHLAILATVGILEAQKHGRIVSYRVRSTSLSHSLRALADAIDECCPTDSACCKGANRGKC